MNPSDRPSPRNRLRRGAGAIEFALSAPILLGFVLAIVDLGRFVADLHRVTSAAAATADIGSQVEEFIDEMDPDKVTTGSELAVLALAARETAKPLALLEDGGVIVTSVNNVDGVVAIAWQRRWGRDDFSSNVSATELRGITLARGESAIFAEVVYRFDPYLLSSSMFDLEGGQDIRTIAVRRPRLAGAAISG